MAKSNPIDYSNWNSFPIPEEILGALKREKLEKPMSIQTRTLKATLLKNKHVLGAAQTGSGKTLAYAIPVLTRILTGTASSSDLKRRICRTLSKKEDFELIDGQEVSVEDMIVDKVEDDNDPDISDDESTESTQTSDSSSPKELLCPEAIILVPTRELAVQVKSEFDKICRDTDVRACVIIGGICQEKQLRMLKRRPQIVIATPGRLYDIVQSDVSEFLNTQSIASLMSLVIDEADRMVQKGHFDELLKILDILKESKKFRRDDFSYRVYLFSATLTFLHELPERLKLNPLKTKESKQGKKVKTKKTVDPNEHTKKNKIRRMLTLLGVERADTMIIDLNGDSSFGRPNPDQLTEFVLNCVKNEKDLYLYYFLVQNPKTRVLIFCNSKDCLRRLSNVLKYLGYNTLKLHSEMDQKKRLSSLEKFRRDSSSVLIATDVAARGLDVDGLECVVHYQVPKTCESYIHRSGRTARVHRKGTSLTLCEPAETPLYRRLCNSINEGKDLASYEVDFKLKAFLKDMVSLAQQCDSLDHKLREVKSNQNWFVKAAQDCDIELDPEDIRQLSGYGKSRQLNVEQTARDKRRLAQLQKQLDSMLKRPFFRLPNKLQLKP